jgi:hypothetical protein
VRRLKKTFGYAKKTCVWSNNACRTRICDLQVLKSPWNGASDITPSLSQLFYLDPVKLRLITPPPRARQPHPPCPLPRHGFPHQAPPLTEARIHGSRSSAVTVCPLTYGSGSVCQWSCAMLRQAEDPDPSNPPSCPTIRRRHLHPSASNNFGTLKLGTLSSPHCRSII